eukprot:1872275-Prymnesium_polylepis.1
MGRVPVARGCELCARSRPRHTHQPVLTNARLLTIPPTPACLASGALRRAHRPGATVSKILEDRCTLTSTSA